MTTSPQVLYTNDVFSPNDVYVLERESSPPFAALSAIAWLFNTPPRSAHVQALVSALDDTARATPSLRPWLLVGQPVACEDTPVTRRRRLWSTVPVGEFDLTLATNEYPVAFEGGLRWFGGLPVDTEARIRSAANIIERQAGSALVAIEPGAEQGLAELLATGWKSVLQRLPTEVLRWTYAQGGMMFWPVGAFDDPESGVVGLGPGPLIERIFRAT